MDIDDDENKTIDPDLLDDSADLGDPEEIDLL